jgi:hypothetical protein
VSKEKVAGDSWSYFCDAPIRRHPLHHLHQQLQVIKEIVAQDLCLNWVVPFCGNPLHHIHQQLQVSKEIVT